MPGFKPGDEVRYCDGTADRRAQVTEVSESGDVLGIAVYVQGRPMPSGGYEWHIEGGVTPPKLKLATTLAQHVVEGFFWKQG